MDRATHATRWTDFGLTIAWKRHSHLFPMLSKMRVVPNISADSGDVLPKTGVYVSFDDLDATLQFAWTGSPSGQLLKATTFNATGKSALALVGRSRLWVNRGAMLRLVLENISNPDLRNDPFFDDSQTPELAPSLIARNAFTSHPSRWFYVELIKMSSSLLRLKLEIADPKVFALPRAINAQKRAFTSPPQVSAFVGISKSVKNFHR